MGVKSGKAVPSVAKIGLSSLALAGCAAFASGIAVAQTPPAPSQIPPGDRADQPTPAATLSLPAPKGLEAPANAEQLRVVVGTVNIDGAFGGVSVTPPQPGATITVADIYRYAAQLQQTYLDAGYPLARVVVPAQDLSPSGSIRIRVVSGFVERIDVSNVPMAVRGRITDVLRPLVNLANPQSAVLERRLLLAGDTAGVSLKSALSPGNTTGGTVLVVTGEHDLLNGVISVDNSIGEELGRYQATASASLNSAFGLGERIIVTVAGPGDETLFEGERAREFAAVALEAPLGIDGLTLGIDGVYARSRPGGALAVQQLESEFTRVNVGLSYPIVRTRQATHRISLSVERAEERQSTNIVSPAATLSLDSTTVIRAGVSGEVKLTHGASFGYDARLSRGIDALGARTADAATPLKPLSREGADAEFSKVEVSGQLFTPVGLGANLLLSGKYTSGLGDALLRSEQGAIVGPGLVSGPPSGSLVGDDAVVGRAELDRPLPYALGTLVPYLFAAAGKVSLRNPTVLEREQESASSVGVGLRSYTPLFNNATLIARLEWSYVEAERQDLDRSWLSGSLSMRF